MSVSAKNRVEGLRIGEIQDGDLSRIHWFDQTGSGWSSESEGEALIGALLAGEGIAAQGRKILSAAFADGVDPSRVALAYGAHDPGEHAIAWFLGLIYEDYPVLGRSGECLDLATWLISSARSAGVPVDLRSSLALREGRPVPLLFALCEAAMMHSSFFDLCDRTSFREAVVSLECDAVSAMGFPGNDASGPPVRSGLVSRAGDGLASFLLRRIVEEFDLNNGFPLLPALRWVDSHCPVQSFVPGGSASDALVILHDVCHDGLDDHDELRAILDRLDNRALPQCVTDGVKSHSAEGFSMVGGAFAHSPIADGSVGCAGVSVG